MQMFVSFWVILVPHFTFSSASDHVSRRLGLWIFSDFSRHFRPSVQLWIKCRFLFLMPESWHQHQIPRPLWYILLLWISNIINIESVLLICWHATVLADVYIAYTIKCVIQLTRLFMIVNKVNTSSK